MHRGSVEIRKKSQLTLPVELCKSVGCAPGSLLYFFETGFPNSEETSFEVGLSTEDVESFARARVRERNQITLPNKVARKLNVVVGDSIEYLVSDEGAEIARAGMTFYSESTISGKRTLKI